MKYPQDQYKVLKSAIQTIEEFFEVKHMHPSALHYIVYQQFSEGQTHNKLYINGEDIARAYHIEARGEDLSMYAPIISQTYDFQLYPEGCNESHIETAVKKVLKELA